MSNIDEFVGFVILCIILIVMLAVGAVAGVQASQNAILSNYCESQSAQHEVIDGVDYCLKDNQLTQIEWME